MANTMRWRYGETNPVMIEAFEQDLIEIGDLIWRDVNVARPASVLLTAGSQDLQSRFKENFLGVAMQCSPVGAYETLRVATTGVFEFESPESRYELGDFLGALMDGGVLANQSVQFVGRQQAIGRCCKGCEGNKVLIDIVSTIMRGGV